LYFSIEFTAKDINTFNTYCALYSTDKCQQVYKTRIQYNTNCTVDDVKIIDIIANTRKEHAREIEGICTKDEYGNICPVNAVRLKLNSNAIDIYEYYKDLKDAVWDTCKSKICTENYIKFDYDNLRSQNSYNNSKKRQVRKSEGPQLSLHELYFDANVFIINSIFYIDSKECKSKAQDPPSNITTTTIGTATSSVPTNTSSVPSSTSTPVDISDLDSADSSGTITIKVVTSVIVSIGIFLYTLL